MVAGSAFVPLDSNRPVSPPRATQSLGMLVIAAVLPLTVGPNGGLELSKVLDTSFRVGP